MLQLCWSDQLDLELQGGLDLEGLGELQNQGTNWSILSQTVPGESVQCATSYLQGAYVYTYLCACAQVNTHTHIQHTQWHARKDWRTRKPVFLCLVYYLIALCSRAKHLNCKITAYCPLDAHPTPSLTLSAPGGWTLWLHQRLLAFWFPLGFGKGWAPAGA